jgi:hypothetical protein
VLPLSRPRDARCSSQRRVLVDRRVQIAIMSILTEPESKFPSTGPAKQLQSAFDAAHIRIRDVQARFYSRTLETSEDVMGHRGSGSMSNTPEALAAEVTDYMVCLPHPPTLSHLALSVVFHAQVEVPVSREQCQR